MQGESLATIAVFDCQEIRIEAKSKSAVANRLELASVSRYIAIRSAGIAGPWKI
jgi:hypothetical protein